MVTRRQLLALGVSARALECAAEAGRLHQRHRGVYAVGRPELTRLGQFMAAVLACGDRAVLSHRSAGALWRVCPDRPVLKIEVSVPASRARARPGITVHRRRLDGADLTRRHGIPVTTPACTLVDLATVLERPALERAVNEADQLGLIDPERLRAKLGSMGGRPGVRVLRALLDRHTFRLTRSELERRFLPLARRAGLPLPRTREVVNGFEVDFFWPQLGLVVETDSLRYHRNPARQDRDRRRDHAHAAAGMTPLRFTHAQVAFDREHVVRTLDVVARRLARRPG